MFSIWLAKVEILIWNKWISLYKKYIYYNILSYLLQQICQRVDCVPQLWKVCDVTDTILNKLGFFFLFLFITINVTSYQLVLFGQF